MSLCIFYNIVLGITNRFTIVSRCECYMPTKHWIFSQVLNCIDNPSFCQDDVELMHSLGTNAYIFTIHHRFKVWVLCEESEHE
jgi:hypothetical protein